MRKRALEVTLISSIYNDTLMDIATNYEDVNVAQKMPTFAVVKSSLYRSCQKRLPPIPWSREDVRLQHFCWWDIWNLAQNLLPTLYHQCFHPWKTISSPLCSKDKGSVQQSVHVLQGINASFRFTDHQPSTNNVWLWISSYSSYRNTFPCAHLHECYFHFAQCLWRKVQGLGLLNDYKANDDMRLGPNFAA